MLQQIFGTLPRDGICYVGLKVNQMQLSEVPGWYTQLGNRLKDNEDLLECNTVAWGGSSSHWLEASKTNMSSLEVNGYMDWRPYSWCGN